MGKKCLSGSSFAHSTSNGSPRRVSIVGPGDVASNPHIRVGGRSRWIFLCIARIGRRYAGIRRPGANGLVLNPARWARRGILRRSTNFGSRFGSSAPAGGASKALAKLASRNSRLVIAKNSGGAGRTGTSGAGQERPALTKILARRYDLSGRFIQNQLAQAWRAFEVEHAGDGVRYAVERSLSQPFSFKPIVFDEGDDGGLIGE